LATNRRTEFRAIERPVATVDPRGF
jgi:hypothetical protein